MRVPLFWRLKWETNCFGSLTATVAAELFRNSYSVGIAWVFPAQKKKKKIKDTYREHLQNCSYTFFFSLWYMFPEIWELFKFQKAKCFQTLFCTSIVLGEKKNLLILPMTNTQIIQSWQRKNWGSRHLLKPGLLQAWQYALAGSINWTSHVKIVGRMHTDE